MKLRISAHLLNEHDHEGELLIAQEIISVSPAPSKVREAKRSIAILLKSAKETMEESRPRQRHD